MEPSSLHQMEPLGLQGVPVHQIIYLEVTIPNITEKKNLNVVGASGIDVYSQNDDTTSWRNWSSNYYQCLWN